MTELTEWANRTTWELKIVLPSACYRSFFSVVGIFRAPWIFCPPRLCIECTSFFQVCSLEKLFPPGQRPGTVGLGSVFWPAMLPWRWTWTSFAVSFHLVPVLQTNQGSGWNTSVLAKIFPARLSEAESLQLSFSSPIFPSFAHRLSSVSGITHRVINKNQ